MKSLTAHTGFGQALNDWQRLCSYKGQLEQCSFMPVDLSHRRAVLVACCCLSPQTFKSQLLWLTVRLSGGWKDSVNQSNKTWLTLLQCLHRDSGAHLFVRLLGSQLLSVLPTPVVIVIVMWRFKIKRLAAAVRILSLFPGCSDGEITDCKHGQLELPRSEVKTAPWVILSSRPSEQTNMLSVLSCSARSH